MEHTYTAYCKWTVTMFLWCTKFVEPDGHVSDISDVLVLLQSGGREVPWADFLREFTARYKTDWSEVRTKIIQVVTGRCRQPSLSTVTYCMGPKAGELGEWGYIGKP